MHNTDRRRPPVSFAFPVDTECLSSVCMYVRCINTFFPVQNEQMHGSIIVERETLMI